MRALVPGVHLAQQFVGWWMTSTGPSDAHRTRFGPVTTTAISRMVGLRGSDRSFHSRARPGSGRIWPARGGLQFQTWARLSPMAYTCARPADARFLCPTGPTLAFAAAALVASPAQSLAGSRARSATSRATAMRGARHLPARFAGGPPEGRRLPIAKPPGLLEMALGAAVLLGWTLLGGLDTLNQAPAGWLAAAWCSSWRCWRRFMPDQRRDRPAPTLYQTFVLEQRFGFNQMTLRLWLADLLKSTLLGALIGILPIAALVLWLMGAQAALVAVGLGPVDGVQPAAAGGLSDLHCPAVQQVPALEDESLKIRVTSLMQRCGFPAKGLFVMDGSRRSAHANAYFTGFRRPPSAWCSSTPCSSSSRPARWKPCWRTNWGISTTATSCKRMVGCLP